MVTDIKIQEIEEITSKFTDTLSSLTQDELNWKPSDDSWSIAQILQHIEQFNRSYFPIIDRIRSDKLSLPWYAGIDWLSRFSGRMLLKASSPDRKFRMRTFAMWKPDLLPGNDDILTSFERHQQELKVQMDASRDLLHQGVVICSPASRWIVYKLETAFQLMIDHEKRHFEQVMEVLDLLRNRRSGSGTDTKTE